MWNLNIFSALDLNECTISFYMKQPVLSYVHAEQCVMLNSKYKVTYLYSSLHFQFIVVSELFLTHFNRVCGWHLWWVSNKSQASLNNVWPMYKSEAFAVSWRIFRCIVNIKEKTCRCAFVFRLVGVIY
jgi:hypothetical protein